MFNIFNINLDDKSISNILQWMSKTVKDNYMKLLVILLLVAISFGITACNNKKMVIQQEKRIVKLELENQQYRNFLTEYKPKMDIIYFGIQDMNQDLKYQILINQLCNKK